MFGKDVLTCHIMSLCKQSIQTFTVPKDSRMIVIVQFWQSLITANLVMGFSLSSSWSICLFCLAAFHYSLLRTLTAQKMVSSLIFCEFLRKQEWKDFLWGWWQIPCLLMLNQFEPVWTICIQLPHSLWATVRSDVEERVAEERLAWNDKNVPAWPKNISVFANFGPIKMCSVGD